MTDIEVGDLEDLLATKGWAWLMAKFDNTWGPESFSAEVERIASKHSTDSKMYMVRINHLIAAKTALSAFLALPEDELKGLRDGLQKSRPDAYADQRRSGI